jgi:hypothetical protein
VFNGSGEEDFCTASRIIKRYPSAGRWVEASDPEAGRWPFNIIKG